MKKSCLFGAACACLTIISFNASAALVNADWQTAGDNLITVDTVTGLNWLDLTETNNMTRDYVVSQLGSGGLFEGFRYATSTEVVALWGNLGVNLTTGVPTQTPGENANVLAAASMLGNIAPDANSFYIYGLNGVTSELVSGSTDYQTIGAHYNDYWKNTYYLPSDTWGISSDFSRGDYGHYLVSVSAVPVPAALWLFGSGLLGLVSIARHKKA